MTRRPRTAAPAIPALAVLAALALVGLPRAGRADTCIDCHEMLEERLAAPTKNFAKDIHALRGLGCASCHGGDPTSTSEEGAMNPDKGFKGSISRHDVAPMCASCHANAAFMKHYNPRPYIFSIDEWKTSVHCKKESEGDQKVATCTNCHGVHGILPHTDPASPVYATNVPRTCAKCHNAEYMKGRTVPTNQFALYSKSVHGVALLEKGDVSAPACNDCHGNHGAVPPGLKDISRVCETCHGREGDLFINSKMKAAMEAQGKKGCVTCHSNHGIQHPTDAMLGVGGPGVCGDCHKPGSDGERATAKILGHFSGLRDSLAAADSLLKLAELNGMETSLGRESWKQAQDHLVGVRAGLHSFDAVQVDGALTEGTGLADRAASQGRALLKDWRMRRIGMALSLVAILFCILLLVLKIRQVEGKKA